MIRFKQGDIFSESAEAIVNPVNCVGAMGRGLALQFRERFPDNYRDYARACSQGQVQPGRMLVHKTYTRTSPRYIINFPTKRHWRENSRLEDIRAGLTALAQEITNRNIQSIAIPALGAGLGGLDWKQVREAIDQEMSSLQDVEITVLEPGANERKTPANRRFRG